MSHATIARRVATGVMLLLPMVAHGAPQTPPSAPVTVVNTTANPIPVTGTVNVGNLGATTLPVSVTNFPATQQVSGTVNVGNLPAVQNVTVTNASSAPVYANILNGPGMNPFAGVLNAATPAFEVPATVNGRAVASLVVTQLSGGCTGIGSVNMALQDKIGASVMAEFLFRVGTLENGFFPVLSQQTQIYIATGHAVAIGDAVAPHGCRFNLSGYYVTQ
jgi:hypothetical protein